MEIKIAEYEIAGNRTDCTTERFTNEDLKSIVGKIASICYTDKTYDEFFAENTNKSVKRTDNLLRNGHHSPFDQVYFTLYLKNASKITFMALNGERCYSAEESSDRYRPMQLSRNEQQDFDDLTQLYLGKIKEITPNPCKYIERRAEKIALENARYCMPTDMHYKDMFYTVSLRQLNYLYNWAKDFKIEDYPRVCKNMQSDLADFTKFVEDNGLQMSTLKDHFDRGFSFFKNKMPIQNEYGYHYTLNYPCTIACAGQMERHRFLDCHFSLPNNTDNLTFYIPDMLKNDSKRISEVQAIYDKYRERHPQGSLGVMTESANINDFVRVLYERDCAMAQYEINKVVQRNLNTYLNGLKQRNQDIARLVRSAGYQDDAHRAYLRDKQAENIECAKILEHYKNKQYCQANGHCKGASCGWDEGRDFELRRY